MRSFVRPLAPLVALLALAGCEMKATRGVDQVGPVSTQLPEPLEVQIWNTDQDAAAAGVTVQFLVVEGGGRVSDLNVQTDAEGFARTWWTLGPEPGRNEVWARIVSAEPGPFGMRQSLGNPETQFRFSATAVPRVPTYLDDVRPALEASGCLGCHFAGSARDLTTYAGALQRVVPFQPDQSRFLAMAGPGGPMFERWSGSEAEKRAKVQLVRDWIAGGAPKPAQPDPRLEAAPGSLQGPPGGRLTVTVNTLDRDGDPYPDLRVRWSVAVGDVSLVDDTSLSDHQGRARVEVRLGATPGAVTLRASVSGAAPLELTLQVSDAFVPGALAGSTHPIDVAALTVLARRGASPPALASDGEFLQRVTADLAGRLPTPAETRAFLSDASPDKRERLVDALLATSDFRRQWSENVLAVWLQLPPAFDGEDRDGNELRFEVDAALRDAFSPDVRLDALVRGVVQREGTLGAAFDWQHRDYYRQAQAEVLMTSFGGQSARCARCHDHKFDTRYWTRQRAAELGAFFADSPRAETPSFDTDPAEVVYRRDAAQEPSFGAAALLEASRSVTIARDAPEAARRQAFASAFTGSPVFARGTGLSVAAELLWRILPREHLTTDVLTTQAPELVQALSQLVRDEQASLTGIVRALATSRLYQLCSADTVGLLATPDGPDSAFRRHHGEVLSRGAHAALGHSTPPRYDRVVDAMLGRPLRRLEGTTPREDEVGLAVALLQLNYTGTPNPNDDLLGSFPGLVATSPLLIDLAGQVAEGRAFADAAADLVEALLARAPTLSEAEALEPAWTQSLARHPGDRRRAAQEALEDVAAGLGLTAELNTH